MKNKILKGMLMALLFFSTKAVVSAADAYEHRFEDVGDKIITCSYYNEKNKEEFILEFETKGQGVTVDGFNVNTYIKGAQKYNKLVQKKELPANTIGENEIIDYMNYKAKCPAYAASYGKKGYVLSDNKESLSGSEFVLDLRRSRYNKDYCFYSYNNGIEWGFFAKKGKMQFEQNNSEKECPTTIITELDVSTTEDTYERKFYGTDETGIALEVTKNKCESDARTFLQEKYDDPSGVKCYAGSLQDVQSSEGNTEDPGKVDNPVLDCNGLFDYETKQVINSAYFILEIIAILAVIGLTIKDYALAILNSNQDEIKKSNKRLLTRIIVLVVILLLPALINMTLKVFKVEVFNSDPLCGTIKK